MTKKITQFVRKEVKEEKKLPPVLPERQKPTEVQKTVEVQSGERPAHLFKPGQSGNPKGRPLGTKNKIAASDLRRLAFEETTVEGTDGKKIQVTHNEIISKKLIQLAKQGNLKAIDIYYDRTDGKPRQAIDLGGELDVTERIIILPGRGQQK